jgi:hypothetical protein
VEISHLTVEPIEEISFSPHICHTIPNVIKVMNATQEFRPTIRENILLIESCTADGEHMNTDRSNLRWALGWERLMRSTARAALKIERLPAL